MKHERFNFFNGNKFDPYDETSNEELGIEPYPGWVRALIWAAVFVSGFYLVVLPIISVVEWVFSI